MPLNNLFSVEYVATSALSQKIKYKRSRHKWALRVLIQVLVPLCMVLE